SSLTQKLNGANEPLPVAQCLAKIVWTLLTTDISPHDSSMLVESLKAYVVSKSALTSCALCTELVPHNLRTNLLLCKCKAKDVASTLVDKVQICILSNVLNILEAGKHMSPTSSEMKACARD
ncbi:hypothetical protein GN958_ATG22209, partial [Phytophthora infestans]